MKKASLVLIFALLCFNFFTAHSQVNRRDLDELKRQVEKDPTSLQKHHAYIYATASDSVLLIQYNRWIKKFPHEPVIPFAIGEAFITHDVNLANAYLSKAVRLNPKWFKAWQLLAKTELKKGNLDSAKAFMKKAQLLAFNNAESSFLYASLFEQIDSLKYDSLMLDVAYRHPKSELAAKALYKLAVAPHNTDHFIPYFEELKRMFSETQPAWFEEGMKEYYRRLFLKYPKKAFELAVEMVIIMKTNRDIWKTNILNSRYLIDAKNFYDKNNFEAAYSVLESIKLNKNPWYNPFVEEITLFKANILERRGSISAAYDTLVYCYAKLPTDSLRSRIVNYGGKLNYTRAKIDSDIYNIRHQKAWQLSNFTLTNFLTKKDISLSDYRNKVVLLTFWFPTCGPCLNEFKHFEKVLNKVDHEKVVYLAINGGNQDEDFIKPLMQQNNYTFVPLRDKGTRIGNLPFVSIYPTTYLIDRRGQVVFGDFQIDKNRERTLEIMLNEVLSYYAEDSLNNNASK